jgi:hypothetical protein
VGDFCSGGKLGGKAPNDTQKWENAVIMAPTYLAFRGYIPLWVKFFFFNPIVFKRKRTGHSKFDRNIKKNLIKKLFYLRMEFRFI